MTKAPVLFIELYLSEDRLRFYRTSAPVHQSLLREEQFPCLPLVAVEPVVYVDHRAVPLSLEASAPERASLAVGCRVFVDC